MIFLKTKKVNFDNKTAQNKKSLIHLQPSIHMFDEVKQFINDDQMIR
jgi:hypothetical protein